MQVYIHTCIHPRAHWYLHTQIWTDTYCHVRIPTHTPSQHALIPIARCTYIITHTHNTTRTHTHIVQHTRSNRRHVCPCFFSLSVCIWINPISVYIDIALYASMALTDPTLHRCRTYSWEMSCIHIPSPDMGTDRRTQYSLKKGTDLRALYIQVQNVEPFIRSKEVRILEPNIYSYRSQSSLFPQQRYRS